MNDAGISIEAGWCVIRLGEKDRQRLIAELAPCQCVAPKSSKTNEVRARFCEALTDPPVRWSMGEVHGLRVALGHCAGHPPTIETKNGVRARLASALGKLRG